MKVARRSGKAKDSIDLTSGAESLTTAVTAMASDRRLDAGQFPFSIGGLADHAPIYYATLLWNAISSG